MPQVVTTAKGVPDTQQPTRRTGHPLSEGVRHVGRLEHDYPQAGHSLGSTIGFLRRRMGLTQEDLAQGAGVSRSYISMIEGGRRRLTLRRAERLAENLGIMTTDLLGGIVIERTGKDVIVRRYFGDELPPKHRVTAKQHAEPATPLPPCYSPVCQACDLCTRDRRPRGGVAESGLLRQS